MITLSKAWQITCLIWPRTQSINTCVYPLTWPAAGQVQDLLLTRFSRDRNFQERQDHATRSHQQPLGQLPPPSPDNCMPVMWQQHVGCPVSGPLRGNCYGTELCVNVVFGPLRGNCYGTELCVHVLLGPCEEMATEQSCV